MNLLRHIFDKVPVSWTHSAFCVCRATSLCRDLAGTGDESPETILMFTTASTPPFGSTSLNFPKVSNLQLYFDRISRSSFITFFWYILYSLSYCIYTSFTSHLFLTASLFTFQQLYVNSLLQNVDYSYFSIWLKKYQKLTMKLLHQVQNLQSLKTLSPIFVSFYSTYTRPLLCWLQFHCRATSYNITKKLVCILHELFWLID